MIKNDSQAPSCTCPSGDGSLRHPCPAHPAVEQADVAAKLTFINGSPAMCGCQVEYSSGGGEYSDVIYVTLCAKHSGSAILDLVATNRIALTPEYEGQWHADLYLDREIPLAKVEGATPAEAVLALMSAERIDPEQESVEQEGGDRWDALQSIMEWTASENIPDERKLCLIRNAARAALAQPSPVRSSLLINGYQLRAALDFIAPDGTAEQLESEACIEWRQQDADFLEAGLYAFCAEYPEEGGVLLDEEPTNSQPSPALPPFADKVLAKLRRFYDCASDFESGGVDIGRHWLDLLTQLGLLNRVQRSPALWEISQQGEDLLGMPQPSPAQADEKPGDSILCYGCFAKGVGPDHFDEAGKCLAAQAEHAEAERPEVVGYRSKESGMVYEQDYGLKNPEALTTVAECDRIVGAVLRQKHEADTALAWATRHYQTVEQQRDAALANVDALAVQVLKLGGTISFAHHRTERPTHECTMGVGGGDGNLFVHGDHASIKAAQKIVMERDAAQARVAELETKLAELERQEPVATVAKVPGEDWNSLDFHRDMQDMEPGTKLYAAPVAQAQHSVPELLVRAEDFVSGFEDDDEQEGVSQLLADLRTAIGRAN